MAKDARVCRLLRELWNRAGA